MKPIGKIDVVRVGQDPNLLGPYFAGESWSAWWSVLRGACALPMSDAEVVTFRELAERDPPTKQVRELWIIAGRRAGKDSIASLIATFAAAFHDYRDVLRPGERATVLCLAVDRVQASIVHRYIGGYFTSNKLLRPMVQRETLTGLELTNGTEIVIGTSDFRQVRGKTVVCAVCDEIAFWQDDRSASPDTEVYNALVPGMATMPGSMLVGISTPYSRRGILFSKFRNHFGRPDDAVLVIKAPSRSLNPTLPQAIIDAAMEDDPVAAAAEWMGEFRSDIAAYLEREQLDQCTAWGRHELPPEGRVGYFGFADAAGGSGSDSMTVAIAHREGDVGVLDAIREWRPPFVPSAVVTEACELLRRYRCRSIEADKWGAEFVRELFGVGGISCEQSARPKSDIYKEFIPIVASRRCELLDHQKLSSQFLQLERRTARGGRDSIDHRPGGHDDLANAAAGVLVLATAGRNPMDIWVRLVRPH